MQSEPKSNPRNQSGEQLNLDFLFMKHYAPNRCEPRIEVFVKMGVRLGGRAGGYEPRIRYCENAKIKLSERGRVGEAGGCERRIEVIVKMQNKCPGGGGGLAEGFQGGYEPIISYCANAKTKKSEGGGPVRGQGGCERRIEVIVRMQKKVGGRGPEGEVRVDVNEELKFLLN